MSLAYRTALFNGVAFSPRDLFRMGEQGWIYDATISDLSGLFQDSAGTTPVTAVEQPVGKMNDTSGRGNHATQATSAARPTLSARYNLLTKTEQFDDAAWTKVAATVTANTTIAPDGTTTADTITATGNYPLAAMSSSSIAGSTHKFLFWLLKTTGVANGSLPTTSIEYQNSGASQLAESGVVIDINNGVLIASSGWGTASKTDLTITSDGNYWKISYVSSAAPALTAFVKVYIGISGGYLDGTRRTTSFPLTSIVAWGADLRVANDGVNLPAYQRVNTATDYDTAGFPLYLKFDGSDDWMVTAAIDFTATDKMAVFAGVRKLSDAARGIVLELTTTTANNGAFGLDAPVTAAANLATGSRGTANAGAIASGYAAPISLTATSLLNISGDSVILRLNGAQAASDTTDQGTGNYSNAPLYIGRREGTSLPFNGRIYFPFVGLGRAATAGEITNMETYLNTRNKVY